MVFLLSQLLTDVARDPYTLPEFLFGTALTKIRARFTESFAED